MKFFEGARPPSRVRGRALVDGKIRPAWTAPRPWPLMRRVRRKETTMPDGTARRRGRGTVQDVDRHVGARMRERRIMPDLPPQRRSRSLARLEEEIVRAETACRQWRAQAASLEARGR